MGGVILMMKKEMDVNDHYCPTHGDSGIVKPIEITKKEISKKFLNNVKSSKK